MIGEVGFFFTGQVLEEFNFIDIRLCQLIVFLDDLLHGLLKYLMGDAKELAVFQTLDRS